MMIDPNDVQRFREIVAERLGLRFDEGDLGHLEEVLHGRLEANKGIRQPSQYLDRLAIPHAEQAEWQQLATQLTVAETYFFRHPSHFLAFTEVALPERIRQRSATRQLRILSAGCATGEEPYTLAMLVRDALGDSSRWDVNVLGIDVNTALLEKAARGQYTQWSLRATPAHWRQSSFRNAGQEFVVNDALRAMVSFETRNLMDTDADFWRPSRFDIIFFRNVSIYFGLQTTKAVVAKIARSLAPGGYLFLGPSETLRGVSTAFHLRHTHDAFYYQRTEQQDMTVPDPSFGKPEELQRALLTQPQPLPEVTSWVEAIGRASAKIATLAGQAQEPRSPEVLRTAPNDVPTTQALWSLAPAWEYLRQERYGEVLLALESLPAEAGSSADVLLLRGVALTNAGKIDEAQRVCGRVLALDELNAGARYLMALCREHLGDRPAALLFDQTAVYLDPNFSMPRLHMGLLARRTGDSETARAELTQALSLLEREDASRILLFGGGFSREALMRFCRAELRACGGEP